MAKQLKSLRKPAQHKVISIYGQPGSGKTSFINTLKGNTLIIDCDNGLDSVNEETFQGSVVEVEEYNDVLYALEQVDGFDYIVIDHFTKVQELQYRKTCEDLNIPDIKGWDAYGKAHSELKRLIDELVFIASVKKKHVIVLVQENRTGEGEDDKPYLVTFQLSPKVADYLQHSSRIIAHTERYHVRDGAKRSKDTKKVETQFKEGYRIRLGGDPKTITKVTRKQGLEIPDTVSGAKASHAFINGLTDGSTQAKLAEMEEKKKQKKADKKEK